MNDILGKPMEIVCNIVPPIGVFLYIKNRKDKPLKAKKALGAAITGSIIAILMKTYIIPLFSNQI